ncbi:hypothetical protein ACIU1J_18940 [Azospirillum doebereinerae]|uniref:hypothetical protein n=1 Tax=Azospirillum doebereinerae TaxID=92933 RepID=UPI00384E2FE2
MVFCVISPQLAAQAELVGDGRAFAQRAGLAFRLGQLRPLVGPAVQPAQRGDDAGVGVLQHLAAHHLVDRAAHLLQTLVEGFVAALLHRVAGGVEAGHQPDRQIGHRHAVGHPLRAGLQRAGAVLDLRHHRAAEIHEQGGAVDGFQPQIHFPQPAQQRRRVGHPRGGEQDEDLQRLRAGAGDAAPGLLDALEVILVQPADRLGRQGGLEVAHFRRDGEDGGDVAHRAHAVGGQPQVHRPVAPAGVPGGGVGDVGDDGGALRPEGFGQSPALRPVVQRAAVAFQPLLADRRLDQRPQAVHQRAFDDAERHRFGLAEGLEQILEGVAEQALQGRTAVDAQLHHARADDGDGAPDVRMVAHLLQQLHDLPELRLVDVEELVAQRDQVLDVHGPRPPFP